MEPQPPAPVRSIRLLRRPQSFGALGVFSIRYGDEMAVYPFRELPCFVGGRGFAVHRWGTRRFYHVRVGEPQDCSCECLGFLSRCRCRHILGLRCLLRRGKLGT